MTSPAAARQRPPARRPAAPAGSDRSGTGRSQASHRPLQLELFGGGRPAKPQPALRPHAEFFRRLSRLIGGRLRSLWLTDNRRTILSVRPQRGIGPAIDLRIHRSFALAPEPVLRAVAAFLGSSTGSPSARRALVSIREHFHHHRPDAHTLPPAGPAKARRLSLCPVGDVLDLRQIAGDLNQRYFDGRLHKVRITWGKATGESSHAASRCRRARATSLQLGSYSYEDRLIRIHRVLDRADVPRYVVESVVYHELLHADLPPVTRNGRRYFHTPEFRRRERHFRQFERADCWVRDNLHQLLRARRAAAPEAASGAGHRRRRG